MTSPGNQDHRTPLGEAPPAPPEQLEQPLASSAVARFAFRLRERWLRLTHRKHDAAWIPKPDQVQRLLAVQNERLGDLVVIEPALRALRYAFPDAERTLLAPSFAAEIYGGAGWGRTVETSALGELRRGENYDLIVDFTARPELRIARALARSGAPVRAGWDRGGRGVYHSISLSWPDVTLPMRELQLRLAGAVGGEAVDAIPRLPRGEDRLERGWRLWLREELREPVALLPGAFYPAQRWSAEAFVACGRVLEAAGFELAVISGPGESDLGRAVAEPLSARHINAPDMRELMDRLASCRGAICNNTGTLHLAAALGLPTVSTMGPTLPWRWWPAGDAPQVVFRGHSDAATGDLSAIDPAELGAAAVELFRTHAPARP